MSFVNTKNRKKIKMKMKKLVIIKDTRESNNKIYLFKNFTDVLMLRNNLVCGDFSVAGFTREIFVERKTISDLCGSFTHDRERFEDEWRRAGEYLERYLMIEGNFADIISHNYQSAVEPNSLIGSILGWSLKYNFNWFFVEDEKIGEVCLHRLFLNFLRLKKEDIL